MAKVKSAERTFRLVELIASHHEGLSFTQLLASLAIPRSSAHSLIQEFLDNDYLLYVPDNKKYYAGLALIKVAANCIDSTDLIRDLRLLTTFLSKKLGKTTHAAILDGNQVIYLAKTHAQEDLSLMRNIGNHLPAHCTAVGKVLLSQYSDEDIVRLYKDVPLEKMTVNSISTLAVLLAELKQVRQQGYALDQREANERAACLALPLYATSGKMIAAFSVTFLAYEWESLPTDEVLQVMKESRAMVH
ncbi:HTH-type transcriptional regulator XynR [Sodalis praecaptivus]|uniref:IclR family transcriptional regulator n=1 Tax=Sodalis praecaptivus TaxID=1239307 RepID=UPI0027FA03CC|nr:IclR family transcriptional regulator [Sodalis praecaptivus]CAJ0996433.1 HTH-type transcriptional regulator XynR [Sodalis praecaptivus]